MVAGAQQAADLDIALDLQAAREHDGIGLQVLQGQHRVGGAELLQQPAGVLHPAGLHQGVERLLVAGAILDVAHEPAETVGTGVLGAQEAFRQFHGAEVGGAWGGMSDQGL